MKAAAISLRIADFLKQYPPFQFLPLDQLISLAEAGRVKFHEDGEIIFAQGQPRDRWLYVIQQGKLRIVEESEGKEELIDYRGPGDMLGLQGIRSDEPYIHSCKTETEAILYALPREQFISQASHSSEAQRYLAAYFSLNPAYHWSEKEDDSPHNYTADPITLRKGGLFEIDPPHSVARSHLVVALEDTSVREIARKLQSKRIDCVIITDSGGYPLGKLSDSDIRDRVLEGKIDSETRAGEVMFTDLELATPTDTTADLLVKLTRSGKHFLVVTEDGTMSSPATGLVSERNLFLHYGRFPSVIGEAVASAPDIGTLSRLRDRIESLILEFLESRVALRWLMELTGVLNRKMSYRLCELSQRNMEKAGWERPPLRYSWLMMGSGGRDELLIRSAVYHALVYEDPPEDLEDYGQRYFQELARRTAESLRLCGFRESVQGVLAQNEGWCLPLSAFKEKFRNLISNPVENHVYNARDAFDFCPLLENCELAAELRDYVHKLLPKHPGFIIHMAGDSLINQPPRTIFQGYVVDNRGIQREELEIKSHALLPLVDVARVLALEAGCQVPTSTYKRLELAADRFQEENPRAAALFREASEAFQISQFARINRGLKAGTDGAVIRPGNLDAETRTLLVTAFRTIVDVLEFTASHYKLEWRA